MINSDLAKQLSRISWLEWAGRPLTFHFWWIDLQSYYNCYRRFIGKRYGHVVVEGFSDGRTMMYRDKAETARMLGHIRQQVLPNVRKLKANLHTMELSYKALWKLAPKLRSGNFESWSTAKLQALIRRYYLAYQLMIGAISTSILVDEAIADQLRKRLSQDAKGQENVELALRALCTPKAVSKVTEEEIAFYKLLSTQRKPGFAKRFGEHVKKWSYIPVYSSYQPWSMADFKQRIVGVTEANRKLHSFQKAEVNTEFEIRKLIQRYHLSQKEQAQVNLLRDYLYWRINDETTIGLMAYSFEPLLAEVCRRLYISQRQALHLTVEELLKGLSGKSVPVDLAQERILHYLMVISPRGVSVYSGQVARQLRKAMPVSAEFTKTGRANIVKGVPANPGKVRGIARIVYGPGDMNKVKSGNILIAPQTTPPLVPAMKRAGAIITNEGGITSHAAIVSRELGVPCVIGTKVATKIFKDGDKVEVDATKGIVKKVK